MPSKFLIVLFLCVVSHPIFAQDTTYLDLKGAKVKSMALCETYMVQSVDSLVLNGRIVREYWKEGKMKLERHFVLERSETDGKQIQKLNGKFKVWYKNGQLKEDLNYVNNTYDGQIYTFWGNGQMKRDEFFEGSRSVGGKCFDANGSTVIYTPFEMMPQFPGGIDDLMLYLSKNIKFPKSMFIAGKQGKVRVGFLVNKDGCISKVTILSGLSPEFDEEAMRVVSAMPNWIPGKRDGDLISVHFVLPVVFKLNR